VGDFEADALASVESQCEIPPCLPFCSYPDGHARLTPNETNLAVFLIEPCEVNSHSTLEAELALLFSLWGKESNRSLDVSARQGTVSGG
jgi:hypothetical protein